MARKAKPWKCRRKSCGNINRVGTRKCQKCGNPRPKKRQAAHMAVLTDESIEVFIKRNGGNYCWICEKLGIKKGTKLFRDHNHRTHKGRGILCYWHNRFLPDQKFSLEELRLIVKYLETFDGDE